VQDSVTTLGIPAKMAADILRESCMDLARKAIGTVPQVREYSYAGVRSLL